MIAAMYKMIYLFPELRFFTIWDSEFEAKFYYCGKMLDFNVSKY